MKALAHIPRGNPNLPPAEFLFTSVSQWWLERNVVAAVLKVVWAGGLSGEKKWETIKQNAIFEAKEKYDGLDAALKALLYLDAINETARDRRHVRYHWEHSSFLIVDLFDFLAKTTVTAHDFTSFVKAAENNWAGALTGPALTDIARGYQFRGKITDPSLITAVKEIDGEYLSFLAKHPDTIDLIAWEAFEKICSEIFRSFGFETQHIGKEWGMSADLLVLNKSRGESNQQYIVECKRYQKDRRVGIDIVNGVLGSKVRKNADAAFLVTTSSFTSTVEKERSNLETLGLFLRDGQQLIEWLEYHYSANPKLRSDTGPKDPAAVWLPSRVSLG